MKDNPESGEFMTFANHYDLRILYSESQMSNELSLQVGYFNSIQNNNLKGILIPSQAQHGSHFRLRVRMHYCTTICSTCISLEIKPPTPSTDYN
jgi:hypothetical protein